jgi:hypothetical protein
MDTWCNIMYHSRCQSLQWVSINLRTTNVAYEIDIYLEAKTSVNNCS